MAALTQPGGRLNTARDVVRAAVARSRFLDVLQPHDALYAFPAVDQARLSGFDDEAFALDLPDNEGALLVPESSFNVATRNYFRGTLLPEPRVLDESFMGIERQLMRMAAVSGADRRVA